MSTGSERCWPVAVWCRWRGSCGGGTLPGVRPTTRAILSMWRSSAKRDCGAPKPRKAPWGAMLVAMALAWTVEVRPVVRAGRVDGGAREDDGRERGVGAAVDGDVDLAGEEFAVSGDGGAMARAAGVTLGGGDEVFGAVVADLYRVAGFDGE